jgi:DNA topoisomerase I
MAAKNVVIVESPAKAQTIEKFLGKGYKVVASYGHIRDLPKSKLGVDVEHNFEPQYIIPRGSGKQLDQLKKALKDAKKIYLATDYDREGEAIAWHLVQAIPPTDGQDVQRITFTEITEDAIKEAVKRPRQIDQNLVDAQQARRILDRLVGYSLSPILWQKVRRGLSAGRVQSVALKLIVDREREIQAFKPEEYWTIGALFKDAAIQFEAKLAKIKGEKAEVKSKAEADKILSYLSTAIYKVAKVDSKEVKRSPQPPFITSSLQQDASNRLSFSAKKTMTLAQQLYEAGLISYMRTDSYSLSTQATSQAKAVIIKTFGAEYASDKPRVYKKKVRGAQEAHEAIRPTNLSLKPEEIKLGRDHARLYELIWRRTLASQMNDARYRQDGADIEAGDYRFRASGRTTLFAGFTKVYGETKEEEDRSLPALKEGQGVELIKTIPEQHFTEPPPRYSEASLIRKLEENGIGRPSTYAPTISTLQARGYVQVENRQLIPQEIGFLVSDMLKEHFPFVVSEEFTAEMEDKLDDIAEGSALWQPVIKDFYVPFEKEVKEKGPNIKPTKPADRPTDEKCEVCGKPMVIKNGRFGDFMACTGFPDCKNTKTVAKTTGATCPEDGGEIIIKKTKKGRIFYGCSNYPNCKYATWTKPKSEQSED